MTQRFLLDFWRISVKFYCGLSIRTRLRMQRRGKKSMKIQPQKKSKKMLKTGDKIVIIFAVLSVTLIAGYMMMHKKNVKTLPHEIKVHYSYDTDIKNDDYIKGNLTLKQLALFDKILERERLKGGLKLSNEELALLSDHDYDLSAAYLRWRSCKEMMRSDHRSYYPSERKYFNK